MAKKSAKSKGYRKTIKKKPFLTKKEIIELVVILAIIVVGVLLFNIFYDDGYIKDVKAGEVVSYASAELRDRYKKLADIGEVEGYTLEERAEDASPIEVYTFVPDDPNNEVSSFSVNGSFLNAESLCATTLAYMEENLDDSSAVQQTTIQGYDAFVFSYSYSEYDETYGAAAEPAEETAAEETTEDAATEEAAEEPAHNKFSQSVNAYIAVDADHTLCLHIYRKGADESFYLAEEELVDYVKGFESAFTLVQPE